MGLGLIQEVVKEIQNPMDILTPIENNLFYGVGAVRALIQYYVKQYSVAVSTLFQVI